MSEETNRAEKYLLQDEITNRAIEFAVVLAQEDDAEVISEALGTYLVAILADFSNQQKKETLKDFVQYVCDNSPSINDFELIDAKEHYLNENP